MHNDETPPATQPRGTKPYKKPTVEEDAPLEGFAISCDAGGGGKAGPPICDLIKT